MALTLITPPAVEPLTLEEVKLHLRVDASDEDNLINIYIRAAREFTEAFLGRALVTQTWKLTIDEFPIGEIKIPKPPLQSVSNVKYFDSAGLEQTLATSEYYVDAASEPGWVVPVTNSVWPTPLDAINAVSVEFVAGYSPTADSPSNLASNVPFNIKAGMLLIIGNLYENREDNVVGVISTRLPNGAEYLLRRHKFDLSLA